MTRPISIQATAAVLLGCWLAALSATASNLPLHEATVGSGVIRQIPTPASEVPIEIVYSPASAEGGGLFGMSEVRIVATGDLTLSANGFTCTAANCLYNPLPFTGGNEILVTAGDELLGEVATSLSLLTAAVSGTKGIVAVVSGEYLDATGAAAEPGAIRPIDATVLVSVPEAGFGGALALGALSLLVSRRGRVGKRGRATRRPRSLGRSVAER